MALITPPGILSFAQLFSPRAPKGATDERFSCSLIFDDVAQKTAAFKELKEGIFLAAADRWGKDKLSDPKFSKKLKWPLKDGADMDYEGYGPGKVFIQPWQAAVDRKTGAKLARPQIVDINGNEIVNPNDVWAGQIARAYVRPFCYPAAGGDSPNMGVSLGLIYLQIIKQDMPRIDGRKSASQAFGNAPIEGVDLDTGTVDSDDLPF
jgi:Protein of unknown function (DUF2815)